MKIRMKLRSLFSKTKSFPSNQFVIGVSMERKAVEEGLCGGRELSSGWGK